MRNLARLFNDLDASTSSSSTLDGLGRYFRQAEAADVAWLLDALTGARIPRLLALASLRAPTQARAALDDRLFEASLAAVGNLAETIALVLPRAHPLEEDNSASWPVHVWWHSRLLPLRQAPAEARAATLIDWLLPLEQPARLVVIKLASGTLRWRVNAAELTQALAHHAGCTVPVMAQRLQEQSLRQHRWDAPSVLALWRTEASPPSSRKAGHPLPFTPHRAISTNQRPQGRIDEWLCQWAIEGTRIQIVRERGTTWVWSAHLELITDRWPALVDQSQHWPDGTVIEGTVPDDDDQGLRWRAHDLLVWQGEPLTPMPLARRHALLIHEAARCCDLTPLPEVVAPDLEALDGWRRQARQHHARGLLIRSRHSGVGEADSAHCWLTDPLVIQAVLTYVQPQAGLSASGALTGTFALRRDATAASPNLTWTTVTKADLALSDAQRQSLSQWARQATLNKFGPVREVEPRQVFDIGFDTLERSRRHQCGWRLSGARVLRWRQDLQPEQADGLSRLDLLQSIDKDPTTPSTLE